MSRISYLSLLCLYLLCHNAFSQDSTYLTIKGKTINKQLEPISFVSITVLGTAKGTISNEKGEFKIVAKLSDTLSFSSIVYNKLRIPVKMLNKDFNYVSLQERVYELEAIDIEAARWQDFKYDFMNTKLKPMEKDIVVIKGLPDPYKKLLPPDHGAKLNPLEILVSPATFLYELMNPEYIRKRKQRRWNQQFENSCIKIGKKPLVP